MEVFTTAQVGKICGISGATVRKLIDDRQIKAYRVPGSQHRRVPRAALVEFMLANGIPMDGLPPEKAEASK